MSAASHEGAALAVLAARGLAGAMSPVEELHRAIADRSFQGAAAAPARLLHDGIAGGVYAAVRGVAGAAGAMAAALEPGGERALSGSPRGALAQGAVNGFLGDRLEVERSALLVEMAVRVRGRDVPLERGPLAAAFPGAGARVVVFLHGLCETEHAWRFRARSRGGTYASRLAAEHGATPVMVRFNTGLHVSENGARLAELLEGLVGAWPVEVERIDLIGHSMGGLVARSACHAGAARAHRWTGPVRTTVTLGTPHHGAPLEQAVDVAGWLLRQVPEGRPLASVLEVRSDGIRDLRFGAICEEDWAGQDPDALLSDRRSHVPLHAGARHYAVAATLTAAERHPLARMLGDGLVLVPSAHGLGRRRIGFADEDLRHLGGVDHLALLNHPAVEELLVEWLRA